MTEGHKVKTRLLTGPQKRGVRARRGERVMVMHADFPPGAMIDCTGGHVTVVGSTMRPR